MSNIVLTPKTGTQVGNAVIPNEGPIAVPYNLNFALSTSYTINVRDLLQTGPGYPGLSRIQSLWVDNSQNTAELIIQITQTNQFIYVPPQSQGYYSVLSPNAGQINISTSAVVTSLCYLTVLNFPVSGDQWYPYGAASGSNTYTGGNLNTLDATLAATKGTTSSANAIPVYTVNGGGNASTLIYSGNLLPTPGGQNLVTDPGASQHYYITSYDLSVIPSTYAATVTPDYINIGNYNEGINLLSRDFTWPSAATQASEPLVISRHDFHFPFQMPAGSGIYFKTGTSTSLTGGPYGKGMNLNIWGYLI